MTPGCGAIVWWAGTHAQLGIHSYKCHKMTPGCRAIVWWAGHWCLKSMKRGFARAKVLCLKNLDILSPRIDAKKLMDDTLQDTEEIV